MKSCIIVKTTQNKTVKNSPKPSFLHKRAEMKNFSFKTVDNLTWLRYNGKRRQQRRCEPIGFAALFVFSPRLAAGESKTEP